MRKLKLSISERTLFCVLFRKDQNLGSKVAFWRKSQHFSRQSAHADEIPTPNKKSLHRGIRAFQPSAAEFALSGDLIKAISDAGLREPTDRNYRLAMALVLTALSRSEIAWSLDFSPHLLKAIRHLEENLANDLSIESLAPAVGIGEPSLREDFQKTTKRPRENTLAKSEFARRR